MRREWPLAAWLVAASGCALLGYDFDKGPPAGFSGAAGGTGGAGGEAGAAPGGSGGGEPVPCTMAEDCPGEDTECGARTCIDGTCGMAFVSEGTPVGEQGAGDCQLRACDGAGTIELVADRDPPVDGNPCTADECDGVDPSNPLLPDGTPCGVALSCTGGLCTGCMTGADCGPTTSCAAWNCLGSTCVPMEQNPGASCGSCLWCQGPLCVPIPNGGPDALSCPASGACGNDGTCDGNGGCRVTPPGVVCGAASCTNQTQSFADTCDGMGSCTDGGSSSCAPYPCGAGACLASCVDNTQCDASWCCTGDSCVDCLSCSEWLTTPGSNVPFCNCGPLASKAVAKELGDCVCAGNCASVCAMVCGSPPGSPTPQCKACAMASCSTELAACQADVGAH